MKTNNLKIKVGKPVVVMTLRPNARETFTISRIPIKDSPEKIKLVHKKKGEGIVNSWVFNGAWELERVAKMFHGMMEIKNKL